MTTVGGEDRGEGGAKKGGRGVGYIAVVVLDVRAPEYYILNRRVFVSKIGTSAKALLLGQPGSLLTLDR